jgi:hypothetical protein
MTFTHSAVEPTSFCFRHCLFSVFFSFCETVALYYLTFSFFVSRFILNDRSSPHATSRIFFSAYLAGIECTELFIDDVRKAILSDAW